MRIFITILVSIVASLSVTAAQPPYLLGGPITHDWFTWVAAVDRDLANSILLVDGATLEVTETGAEVWTVPYAGVTEVCAKTAVETCGQGNVCWVCATTDTCSFACKDDQGNCQPTPPCGSAKAADDATGAETAY